VPGDALERVHHLVERRACVDFRRRSGAQQRLEGNEVVHDLIALRIGLAEVVRLARGHAFEDHLHGRAQQHDRVEPRIKRSLVGDATGEKQHAPIVLPEQRVDPVLAPQPLGPGLPLGPTAVVGVHHSVTSPGELGERRRLARARHPRHEHDGH